MAEEQTKLRKHWVEQAISLALQGRWAEAVTANLNILSLFPSDAEAYNRLGKAYTELGRYAEARDAYSRALQIDPGNAIATKNLVRLSAVVSAGEAVGPPARLGEDERLEPQLFIEEMGKTGITALVNLAPPEVLARLTAGDPVRLTVRNRTLAVESLRGEHLGDVEPRLGQRLMSFMQGGNRYAAAVASLNHQAVRIIIRETFQHPSQLGRVSFPAKGGETAAYRAYIKESALKYELDEEEESAEEGEFGLEGEAVADEGVEETEPIEEVINSQ